MIDSGFMGMVFNNFSIFRIYGYSFFVKIHILVNCFGISGFIGYDFQQILQIYGYAFEKFLRIYGWYFYDLNGTTPYLRSSSYPPPPGVSIVLVVIDIVLRILFRMSQLCILMKLPLKN